MIYYCRVDGYGARCAHQLGNVSPRRIDDQITLTIVLIKCIDRQTTDPEGIDEHLRITVRRDHWIRLRPGC